ncbi:MAG: hypothetical protein KAT68_18990 [Bacteroidales bacterium]|nr:hypothetical protein [Bacteroidales bacterium]
MRTIILAAGQGFKLDGCIKLLIRDPKSGERIIDHYLRIFNDTKITVVVGYKAIEIIQRYPNLHYIYNSDWNITNNSYSLGLALNEEPSIIISSDFIIHEDLITAMNNFKPNCILTENRDNRQLNSLNCDVLVDSKIEEIYQGPLRNNKDPEAIGIYKISDKKLLRIWKKNCLTHGNLFAGQNLNFDISPIYSFDMGSYNFHEINTVLDYLNLIKKQGL